MSRKPNEKKLAGTIFRPVEIKLPSAAFKTTSGMYGRDTRVLLDGDRYPKKSTEITRKA